jgi:hypothetical protein
LGASRCVLWCNPASMVTSRHEDDCIFSGRRRWPGRLTLLVSTFGNDLKGDKMNNHRKAKLEKALEEKGISLEKFSYGDTRRVGGDGTVFRWYTARDGGLLAPFRTLAEVENWTDAVLVPFGNDLERR